MTRVRSDISISLDGYTAGPSPTQEEPLGAGGERLHEWVVRLAAWRRMHGLEGGDTGPDGDLLEEAAANVGAHVIGRNMFGPMTGGPWDEEEPWNGWWGDDPPFRTPVFVLTHHPREALALQGGTTFHFVTDGIESAIEQARAAAGERDVHIGGGADTIRQALRAGLVDELELHVAPVLLGGGTRLFDGLADAGVALEPTRAITSEAVTHVRYRVRR